MKANNNNQDGRIKKYTVEEEVCLTTAYIIYEDMLNCTFFSAYDRALELAKKFVDKYPPNKKWERTEGWDNTVIEFIKEETKR